MDFHPGGVNELMRGVGKDATKLFENVSATISDYPSDQRSIVDRRLFLRTHRSFVAGARLGQLSEHPSEMRGRKAEPWLGERYHRVVADGKCCLEYEQLFVGDVEPDNKLHKWVTNATSILPACVSPMAIKGTSVRQTLMALFMENCECKENKNICVYIWLLKWLHAVYREIETLM